MQDAVPAEYKPINLNELALQFAPKQAKRIPKFVYRRFGKMLHIDEINGYVSQHFCEEPDEFLGGCVSYLDFEGTFTGPGAEALSAYAGQQVMVVSNHPMGGAEALLFLKKLREVHPGTKLLANAFYSLVQPMAKCCVYNKTSVKTLYDAVYDGGESILMYPAGACSRKLSFGDVFDWEWKKGFIKMVRTAGIPLIVCYTDGRASNRYLNFTKVREFFGGKKVVEASYLPDEMFKAKGRTFSFSLSAPIDPVVFTPDVSDQEWADRVRQYCYALKTDPTLVFDPSLEATLPKK